MNEKLPNKHRNHEIEKLSERDFIYRFPTEWIHNSFKDDYGTDYNCEIVKNQNVTGISFSVQLKGKETEKNKTDITISNIKRSTINRWLKKLEPTLLVVYIVDENESYWKWFENNTVDLTKSNKTFSINISRENKLSTINWESISDYVTEIFNKRYLIYDFPTDRETHKKSWDLYFNGKFEQAIIQFKKITNYKKNALIWNAIANCEYEIFNYQKALIAVNKALQIEADNNMINLTKASILTEQGALENNNDKIENAIVIYEKLIKNKYFNSTVFYNYASALVKNEKYKESIPQFKKAIFLNPNKPQIWNNLGNVYMNLGLHNLEMECYDKALKLNPNQSETLFSKGSSLFRYFGEVDEGLKLMLESTEKTDRYEFDLPYLYFWISEAYLFKNEIEKAIDWNNRGLNIFSTDSYLKDQKNRISVR